MERVFLSLLLLAATALAANSGFDAVAHLNRLPPGAIYLVDGRRMRIDCTGSGTPTIVLDAGHGNDGLIWDGIQPILARTTRVCSYDRAGFGWSDPVLVPRDADHIATELHKLLTAAGIKDPVVLMGHSIAGLYIRDYARRYPADVAGLIFVDASAPSEHLDQISKNPSTSRASRVESHLMQAVFDLGLQRLLGACPGSFPGFGMRAALIRLEGLCHEHLKAYTGEWANFDRSSTEVEGVSSYGSLPLLIFSRDTENSAWNKQQEELKRLSIHSRRVIARGSGHYIQLDRPELIAREVSLYLDRLRGFAPQPAEYGSTTIR